MVIVGIDYDSDEHPPRYAVVGTDTDDNHHIVIHARPYPPARPNLLALLTDPGDLT